MADVLVEGLSCERGGFRLWIPRLEVGDGEKVAVLGENGSGKSTLLLCMAGILSYAGRVLVGGREVSSLSPMERARLVAYLPQRVDVAFDYPVYQVVLWGRYPYFGGSPRPEDRRATDRVLREHGLCHLRDRGIFSLSGGERRRVFFAKVVNQCAPLLLLDEPTSMMDVKSARRSLEAVAAGDATVLCVLHDVNLALTFFKRVIFLKEGKVVFDVGSDEVDEEMLFRVYDTRFCRRECFSLCLQEGGGALAGGGGHP